VKRLIRNVGRPTIVCKRARTPLQRLNCAADVSSKVGVAGIPAVRPCRPGDKPFVEIDIGVETARADAVLGQQSFEVRTRQVRLKRLKLGRKDDLDSRCHFSSLSEI